jgi:exodeoxyribonuclease V alpha subunit
MQLRNNYGKDAYNGDVGLITRVDKEKETLEVDFEGRIVPYSFDELDELSLSYACSVHKAQGSEYLAVVMPVCLRHYVLLQRNPLYAGITRDKRFVVLVGTRKAQAIAIRNEKERKRSTFLKERLS